MSERLLKGIGVSPGIAIAPAVAVRWTLPDVPHHVVSRSQVEKEVRRLRAAVRDVKRHIEEVKARAAERAGPDEARIFDAQLLMLEDAEFLAGAEDLIRENHLIAEKAFEFKALEVRDLWTATGSTRLKDRLADLNGVTIRVVRHLMHRSEDDDWEQITEPSIVVTKELGPGLTVQLDREHVVGLLSEEGTRTSHAAILAHSMGMPAVMGCAGALEKIPPGTVLVLDGTRGTVLLDPTPAEIADAQGREQRRRALAAQLEEVVAQPSVTADGVRIVLMGNVDLPDEIKAAQAHRAEGVGLLRTEFLITSHSTLPTEDEQAAYFRRVGEAFPGQPVVIRTYDLGGDKLPPPCRDQRLPERGDERPHAVHAGGGPRHRAARRPLHAARPERDPFAQDGRGRRARGREAGERVRGDGVGAAVGLSPHRLGLRDALRRAPRAAAREVDGAPDQRRAGARRCRERARRAHRGRRARHPATRARRRGRSQAARPRRPVARGTAGR